MRWYYVMPATAAGLLALAAVFDVVGVGDPVILARHGIAVFVGWMLGLCLYGES